jgi:hypothetical protein
MMMKNNWWAPTEFRKCPPEDPGEVDTPLTSATFHDLQPQEKLQILLGQKVGCPTAEKHIDTHVKRFLRKTWQLRRKHVRVTNEKYNRHD